MTLRIAYGAKVFASAFMTPFPPPTVEFVAPAVLLTPPLTVEVVALAVLSNPPETDDKEPDAVFI
jgi:hypothetical protein